MAERIAGVHFNDPLRMAEPKKARKPASLLNESLPLRDEGQMQRPDPGSLAAVHRVSARSAPYGGGHVLRARAGGAGGERRGSAGTVANRSEVCSYRTS
jgi:hypothetical protein